MLIIPAIDLQGGAVVRLTQGDFAAAKTYSRDPVKVAKHWVRQGARMLHVVDLDGARLGMLGNLAHIQAIAAAVSVPVECGGGVRSLDTITALLKAGVSRVVLGTKAAEDTKFLLAARKKFKDSVIVSIDARDGVVQVAGWSKAHKVLDAVSFAQTLKDLGFSQIIFTDISKDGMLAGPSIKSTRDLARQSGLSIIASGGISSLEDVRKLAALKNSGVVGMIIGKALYEGKFTVRQALDIAR